MTSWPVLRTNAIHKSNVDKTSRFSTYRISQEHVSLRWLVLCEGNIFSFFEPSKPRSIFYPKTIIYFIETLSFFFEIQSEILSQNLLRCDLCRMDIHQT
jgi:hypothetical protein